MSNKTIQYRKLLNELNNLENEIMNSDKYIALKDKLEDVQADLCEMTLPVGIKRNEVSALKDEILKSGEVDTDIAEIKFKVSKEVSISKFYELVEDIDIVLSLASIPQTKLKDYAKENNDIKKAVLGCVVETGKKAVDIIII